MTNQIKYASELFAHELKGNGTITFEPLEWQKQGLQETASGYGRKLTTCYKMSYNGRKYRVYSICMSNAGSLYIITKGEKLFIHS